MNWLDFLIILLLLFAVWEGWRQGVVTQVLGLAALGLGILLAWRHGGAIGSWMGLEAVLARIVGFVIVLVVVIAGVVVLGRATRGLFRVVGLGLFDNLLGVIFSCLKMILFVGIFLLIFEILDPDGHIISASTRLGSVMLRVVDGVCDTVFPFIREMFRSL